MAILNSLKQKDDIRLIDYEELEAKYDIHKYYPKYFHNEELSTPSIKEMIYSKPIYAAANEHLKDWVNPGVMKVYETELDLDSGKLKIRKERQEQKKQQRQERKEDRKERREERKEERKERREELKEHREERKETSEDSNRKNSRDSKSEKKRAKLKIKRQLEQRKRLIESKERKAINFNNPWSKNESLIIYENQYGTGEESRKNSVTSKLISLISNTSDDYKLLKTNSYDQTKSTLTSGRKKSLFRKRYSEQIGTYYLLTVLAIGSRTNSVRECQYSQREKVHY